MRTCNSCGESKDLGSFGFRNKAAGRRHQRCKACIATYGRRHYAANSAVYKAHSKANTRSRQASLKARVLSYLIEHPCVDCGQSDPVVLEFDHVESGSKRKELYWMVHETFSWTAIVAEILKCEVRCANCHRRRTAAQFGWPKLTLREASSRETVAISAGPRRPRRAGPPRRRLLNVDGLTPETVPLGLGICYWCGVAKPLEQFHYRDKAKGKRHSRCAECFNAYRRDHYRMNRQEYIQRNTRILRLRGRAWQQRLWDHLVLHPCVDCAEPDPVVLEFDHLEPATKRASVSFLARSGYPWATVLNELAKCEVRCVNCHRRRTAQQFDWPKLRIGTRLGESRIRWPDCQLFESAWVQSSQLSR